MCALLRAGKMEGLLKELLECCDPLLAALIRKVGTPLTMDDLMRIADLSRGRVMWGIGALHGDGVLSQTFIAGSNENDVWHCHRYVLTEEALSYIRSHAKPSDRRGAASSPSTSA